MSRSPTLTDQLIRTALTPAEYVDAPSGLLAAVAAEVRRTPPGAGYLRQTPAIPPSGTGIDTIPPEAAG